MRKTIIIFGIVSFFLLLFTSCNQAVIEEKTPKEKLRVEAYFVFDDGTVTPVEPLTRYIAKPNKTAHNAWVISGLGSYDYNEPLRLAIRRASGATGLKFNVSNSFKVEYVYFTCTTSYSGLPKTVMEAKIWAQGTDFKRLFTGTLGNRVTGDVKMYVKITKSTDGDGVEVGFE